jgi:TetR/AcrR family transcriptional regulator, cholesterol catabolism regulator
MEVRERILQKAIELYFRYGIRSITMDEIAAQCGMSKKTIYQFFEDKDALVAAVMDMKIHIKEDECISTQQKSDNAIHEMFLALENVMALFDNMHASVMLDLQKHHPATFKKLQAHKHKFLHAVIKNNIMRGQREGLYRSAINADIITAMRLETIFMTGRDELFPKSQYSSSQVLLEITYHYLYGLATDKGVLLINKYKQERTKNTTV